jgi:general secretion pathway protein D
VSKGFPALWLVLMLAALGIAGCQTLEDAPASVGRAESVSDTWAPARTTRLDDGNGRTTSGRTTSGGTALLAPAPPAARPTVLEGSGRFIGEPPVGSAKSAADSADDGVTLNLVNVPAPQAAKTLLGDILGVRYTVDPGIEGKVTIQTPKPVARAAVIDLFQAALRSNNAALVNANGMYRIVALDQAAIGARIRTDEAADTTGQVGSGCTWCSSNMWRPPRFAASSSR